MGDLVERLRQCDRGCGHSYSVIGPNGEPCKRVVPYGNMMHEAADRITALENACQAYLDAYDSATGTVYVEPVIRKVMESCDE